MFTSKIIWPNQGRAHMWPLGCSLPNVILCINLCLHILHTVCKIKCKRSVTIVTSVDCTIVRFVPLIWGETSHGLIALGTFLPYKAKCDVKRNCLGPITHCVLQLTALSGDCWLFSLVSPVRLRYFPLLPDGTESICLLRLKVTFSFPSLWSAYNDWVPSVSTPLVTQPRPLREVQWKWRE